MMKVDIRKAYDTVSHPWMLAELPINRKVLKGWLKAGILEKGHFKHTPMGVPQGGPISPTIFNCVMNGVEQKVLSHKGCFLIRYADDLVVFAPSIEPMENIMKDIKEFIKPRGMEINEEKTRIASIEEGMDILGFNLREYYDVGRTKNPKMKTKRGIVLSKPSKDAIQRFKQKLKGIFKKHQKGNAYALIKELNPVIRG